MRKFPLKFYGLLLSGAISAPTAFAMHAYGTDNCSVVTGSGQKLQISQYTENLAAPHRITPESDESVNEDVRFESDLYILSSGLRLGEDDVKAKKAKLILKVLSSTTLEHQESIEDGWENEAVVSTRVVLVSKVSKEIAKKYAITKGDTLKLSCYSDYSAPNESDEPSVAPTVIEEPKMNGYPIQSNSDMNQVCIHLGYKKALHFSSNYVSFFRQIFTSAGTGQSVYKVKVRENGTVSNKRSRGWIVMQITCQ